MSEKFVSKIEMGATKEVPVYEDHKRGKNWMAIIEKSPQSPGGLKRTFLDKGKEVISSKWETGFTPQTVLGKKLISLRNKAIAAGVQLLSEEEVLEEVKRRRGELEGDEADL